MIVRVEPFAVAIAPPRQPRRIAQRTWRGLRSSEIAKGFVVFRRIPFPESGERILERRPATRLGRLGQEDMPVRYGVSDFVARLGPKRGADRLRNRCAGKFALIMWTVRAAQARPDRRQRTLKPERFAVVVGGSSRGDRLFMHLISAPRNLLVSFTSGHSAKILISAPPWKVGGRAQPRSITYSLWGTHYPVQRVNSSRGSETGNRSAGSTSAKHSHLVEHSFFCLDGGFCHNRRPK